MLAFKDLYGRNCAGCHGADGKLGPAPPLNDRLFRALVPEETVKEVVGGGRPGTLMPAFAQEQGGPLTPQQVAVLVNEIKGIPYKKTTETQKADEAGFVVLTWEAARAAAAGRAALPLSQGSDGTGRRRRAKVFADACAACHGDQGQGGKRDDGVAVTINDPAFLALISDQALRRIAITGRPDLGMPDYAHRGKQPLTSQDVTNLAALLSSWRQGGTTGGQDKTRGAR